MRQLFRRPSSSTVLLKRFPGGPGNTQSRQRVGIPGSWPQPAKRVLGKLEPVEPGLQFPISEGGRGGALGHCSALHSTHWQWTWLLRHFPEVSHASPRAPGEQTQVPATLGVFFTVASVPSALSPMLRQAHAAVTTLPCGPGWCPTQWVPLGLWMCVLTKPACPSVLPAHFRRTPSFLEPDRSLRKGRRALPSPRKPLPPKRSRLAHGGLSVFLRELSGLSSEMLPGGISQWGNSGQWCCVLSL